MSLPPQLKPIQHHLRTAQEHETRDPVVAYYCRLYAMQAGMKLDSKSPECRKFLVKLMDQLESMKKEMSDNESITQEVVGNAHIENYAIKMFLYADNEDRSGHFHKNMIKSFYTASLLMDVLSVFGELSEENIQHRKYARWKATYIHNCLKNGETPESGPIGMELDMEADVEGAEGLLRSRSWRLLQSWAGLVHSPGPGVRTPPRESASHPVQNQDHQVLRPLPTSTTSTSHQGLTRRPTPLPSWLRPQQNQ
ncbi:hypothetical protein fugu_017309 [Takifugu bimaculatus]|uniref:Vta1/callose synthase N-terminal domain-containing protein n=1 Tax=Takifugu bimaculatus TaxID=433685 RepID=A0A4Z2BT92_9TELE|nr:hypothetical protein fugu_017309 [Takifugu bimaculatus]